MTPTKLQLAVLLNYIALGSIISFVQGGIAPILYQQGIALNSMAWVFALFLPFGISFLWAPFSDRLQNLYNYKQQVSTALMLAIGLLIIMAAAAYNKIALIYLWYLALLLNIIIASVDLALDALCSSNSNQANTAKLAGAKVAGMSLGALLGSGIYVAQFYRLNFAGIFLCTAILLFMALLVVSILPNQHIGRRASILGLKICWQDKLFRARLWRMIMFTAVLMAIFNIGRLLLVDMGLSLASIGWYLGIGTPIATFIISILMPYILKKYTHVLVFKVISLLLALQVLALIVCINNNQAIFALWLCVTIGTSCAALLLISGSVVLLWAKSAQSATDYALLYGLGRFFGTILLVLIPNLIAYSGWSFYYIGVLIFYIVIVVNFAKLLTTTKPI